MDIRMGNDICMQIHTEYLSDVSNYKIVNARAELVCEHNYPKHHHIPDFFRSTPYSLRDIGPVEYNTKPFNCGGKHHPHAERVIIQDLIVDQEEDTIKVYFKARRQRVCGTYSLVLHIIVEKPGYSFFERKTYTFDFCNLFNLVCRDCDNVTTDTTIDIPSSYNSEHTARLGAGNLADIFTIDYDEFEGTDNISSNGTVYNPLFKVTSTGGYDGLVLRTTANYKPELLFSDEFGNLVYPQVVLAGTDYLYDYYFIPIVYNNLKVLSINLTYDK